MAGPEVSTSAPRRQPPSRLSQVPAPRSPRPSTPSGSKVSRGGAVSRLSAAANKRGRGHTRAPQKRARAPATLGSETHAGDGTLSDADATLPAPAGCGMPRAHVGRPLVHNAGDRAGPKTVAGGWARGM